MFYKRHFIFCCFLGGSSNWTSRLTKIWDMQLTHLIPKHCETLPQKSLVPCIKDQLPYKSCINWGKVPQCPICQKEMHQHFPPLLPFKLISSPFRIPVLKSGQLGLELGQVDQVNLERSIASLHIGSSDQFGTQPINSTELG